jgi:hypothetical protein
VDFSAIPKHPSNKLMCPSLFPPSTLSTQNDVFEYSWRASNSLACQPWHSARARLPPCFRKTSNVYKAPYFLLLHSPYPKAELLSILLKYNRDLHMCPLLLQKRTAATAICLSLSRLKTRRNPLHEDLQKALVYTNMAQHSRWVYPYPCAELASSAV